MQEPSVILSKDTMIRTHSQLGTTAGMMIRAKHLEARRPDTLGKITGVVGGHGGDVYWVTHAGGIVAAYCWSEFELAAAQESLPEASEGSGNLWDAIHSDEL